MTVLDWQPEGKQYAGPAAAHPSMDVLARQRLEGGRTLHLMPGGSRNIVISTTDRDLATVPIDPQSGGMRKLPLIFFRYACGVVDSNLHDGPPEHPPTALACLFNTEHPLEETDG